MKNRTTGKMAVCLGGMLAVMCMVTGCAKGSESAKGEEEEIIRIEASADDSEQKKENGQQEQKGDFSENEKTNDVQETDEKTVPVQTADENSDRTQDNAQDETELEGDVISIGEGSMVVSKIFNYTLDGNGEAEVAVSVLSEDAVLITVYFSENTEFIVRTVKNGGVNGEADAENRAGTSEDLQERKTVLMTGGYEGEDFHAEQVVIYNFI